MTPPEVYNSQYKGYFYEVQIRKKSDILGYVCCYRTHGLCLYG